jgi:hypothetical protein
MKKRVPDMPQSNAAPDLLPVEADRSSSIHLVMPSPARPAPPVVVPKVKLPRLTSRKSHHIRESENMSRFTLAIAALIAPLIWLGHALLLWLDRK